LRLNDIDIKFDTGAYTSSLHCHNIEEVKRKGKNAIKFNLLDPSHPEYNEKEYIIYEYEKKVIKSSSGEAEERYIIKSKIVLFGKKYETDFSLTNRMEMKFPVLIGRKLIAGNFIVDPSRTNLSYKRKLKRK
jgi:hypothetical protein